MAYEFDVYQKDLSQFLMKLARSYKEKMISTHI